MESGLNRIPAVEYTHFVSQMESLGSAAKNEQISKNDQRNLIENSPEEIDSIALNCFENEMKKPLKIIVEDETPRSPRHERIPFIDAEDQNFEITVSNLSHYMAFFKKKDLP